MPSGTLGGLGTMWDVLTWHSGRLSIAWWVVLVLAVALISLGSKSHR
jgi:hypothetical protein